MTKKNEPAFPCMAPDLSEMYAPGLTKREWLAGTLLAGLMANPDVTASWSLEELRPLALEQADAILEDK